MIRFTYWSNKHKAHETELLSVWCEDIATADKIFEEYSHFNPVKTPWISVSIDLDNQ